MFSVLVSITYLDDNWVIEVGIKFWKFSIRYIKRMAPHIAHIPSLIVYNLEMGSLS